MLQSCKERCRFADTSIKDVETAQTPVLAQYGKATRSTSKFVTRWYSHTTSKSFGNGGKHTTPGSSDADDEGVGAPWSSFSSRLLCHPFSCSDDRRRAHFASQSVDMQGNFLLACTTTIVFFSSTDHINTRKRVPFQVHRPRFGALR